MNAPMQSNVDQAPVGAHYDVIVVGARAAGAATAMLLARQGLRVLAVDRATYGSDTLSTHALMRGGVLQLSRWGLLDAVRSSGAPPVSRVTFHYPGESVVVNLKPSDRVDALYAPRRTVLDRIVADAAAAAGADVRFGVTVEALQRDGRGRVNGILARDDAGRRIAPRARLVVGADGIRSLVAREANAPTLREASADGAVVYGYFRGIEAAGFEWVYGAQISAGLIPTNGGEVCVFVGGPSARFRREVLQDMREGFHAILREASPEVAERVRIGEPASRFRGFAGIRGFYRKPWGDGWALVGDAGYFRDPITTHGLTDAFRDAELLARAIASSLNSGQSERAAMEEYERIRDDATVDLFAATDRIASYDWTLDEVRGLLGDVSRAMKAELNIFAHFDAPSAESAA